jgi:hypothetical protein
MRDLDAAQPGFLARAGSPAPTKKPDCGDGKDDGRADAPNEATWRTRSG